jgi:hypothetical protein
MIGKSQRFVFYRFADLAGDYEDLVTGFATVYRQTDSNAGLPGQPSLGVNHESRGYAEERKNSIVLSHYHTGTQQLLSSSLVKPSQIRSLVPSSDSRFRHPRPLLQADLEIGSRWPAADR